MKNIKILVVVLLSVISMVSFGQLTKPGDGNNGITGGNPGPVGGGAPIGSGLIAFVILAAGYGAQKMKIFSIDERSL